MPRMLGTIEIEVSDSTRLFHALGTAGEALRNFGSSLRISFPKRASVFPGIA
jgi:hypothetical protein